MAEWLLECATMIGVPRGRYLGKRLGNSTKSDAEHFIPALPAAAGSTAGILLKYSGNHSQSTAGS